MRENFVAQFVQLSKCWSYNVQLSFVVEKNWALSVDQCWLQVWLHLIELLSILLRCNGFTRIQKDVVDQSAPDHQKMTMTFRGICLALGNA